MLRVLTTEAKPGMVLALPVLHPKRAGTVLLREGLALEARVIERLVELGFTDLWVRYPGMEMLADRVRPAVFESRAALSRVVGSLFDGEATGAHARLEFGAYRDAMGSLMEQLLANPRAAIFLEETAGRAMPALRHATATAFLSVLMGLRLSNYLVAERSRLRAPGARDVTDLGVGAMFHDLGMLRLPADVVAKWNASQDESDPRWREHVRIGYDLVHGGVGPGAAAAVLHHHQRYDGSGFPAREVMGEAQSPPAGSDIHVFARILAAADLFDRLRSGGEFFPVAGVAPPAPAPVPAVRVLRWLQHDPYRRWIDPMIFRALLAVVPAYSPGSVVRLSDGRRCAVLDWEPTDPCRPTVRPVSLDEHARRKPAGPDLIDLRTHPTLRVVEADGADTSADNFYPSRPNEFDLTAAERALFNAAA